jgi:nucleotide-binding universal stress UspA family protein
MSTALETPHAGVDVVSGDYNLLGPILVATDGTTSASAALKATALLADRTGANVTVLAVLEPLPLVAADYGLLLPPSETDEARRQALSQRVREQVTETVGARPQWGVEIRDGDPAAVIARTAREGGARLIVSGIGHHDLLDRMFGGETALHTLRLSKVPVLAVAPKFVALPQRVAIAIDFSEPSIIAARIALALLPSATMVYLVHVAPRLELQPEAYAAWMSDYAEGVEPAFERVRARLEIPAGVTVETMTLTGKPTKSLLEFAKSAHIDAIVTGSRGAGLVDRILVGSTATGLIRGANCSVLAVPAPTAVTTRRIAGSVPDEIPEVEWAEALEAFTRRNAGRVATLEVDDPEFGAQAQQHDYPLLGAAYDRHDRRIELMLGEMENSTRHLTRGIGDVRHLDLLKDAAGRDWVLRIAHGSGQTILTLAR